MSDPLVSVILPVRDGAATLARAIDSIRAQTCREWELIVVDDGSCDGSVECAEAAAARDPRIRLVAARTPGLVPALNTGLANARGSLVARMDADDESHPDRFAAQVAALTRDPSLGLVGSLVAFGGDRGANEGYALHVDWLNRLVTPDDIAVNRFVESPFAHPSVMFRRALVDRLGGYRGGDFPEDYELWLRWLDHGVRMAKVPQMLLTWHDSASRLSRCDARYRPEAFYRLKAHWLARELPRASAGRPTWIWGAGRPTRKRVSYLQEQGVAIAGYIDVDPKKATLALGGDGVPVIPPAALTTPAERFVLGYVAKRGARAFIRGQLDQHGYREGADFLMCA